WRTFVALINRSLSGKTSALDKLRLSHGVLAEEKMEHIGKEKSSFHDQGHQQAVKGKEEDEEFGEICWH
ncbi:hypothetical protein Tco_0372236, partial [Tanacetum coccineum]